VTTRSQQTAEHLRFSGVRVEVLTPRPFAEVLDRLRREVGSAPAAELDAATKRSRTADEFAREVNQRVGPSGFVLFFEIDHGSWIGKFGIQRKALRWILGNPLIAITMIRHDIQAGLFVPVELYVVEQDGDAGTIVSYVVPSSLIAVGDNRELREAAEALDRKLEHLVLAVTEVE
jgi:uncharacterized protein (DUF302 family)